MYTYSVPKSHHGILGQNYVSAVLGLGTYPRFSLPHSGRNWMADLGTTVWLGRNMIPLPRNMIVHTGRTADVPHPNPLFVPQLPRSLHPLFL